MKKPAGPNTDSDPEVSKARKPNAKADGFRQQINRTKTNFFMKNVIVILLVIAGLFLAVKGINTIQSSTADVEILGLEINANDESGQTAGILYLILGAAALAGSYFAWKRG